MTVLASGNSNPLVFPPPPSTKGITSTPLPAPEVIDGPNNAVYGNSPPVATSFTLVISTTFPITVPGLTLTFTGPSGQTFIANPSDFFVGQDTLTLPTPFPPNSYLEYTISTPSLFNQAGDWTVTLSIGGQSFPTQTYHLGIGGFLPPSAIAAINAIGSYTAQGVLFKGTQPFMTPFLTCSSLNCINPATGQGGDNGRYSFSFWAQGITSTKRAKPTLWQSDPNGDANPTLSITSGGSQGVTLSMLFDTLTTGYSQFPFVVDDGNWHHYLGSWITSISGGAGVLYVDDQVVGPDTFTSSGVGNNAANGKTFHFAGDGENQNWQMGFSDVWIAPGIGLLVGDLPGFKLQNIISYKNRRIFTFIDNSNVLRPVNPLVSPAFPPAPILFSGGASIFGANFDFGGGFTLMDGSLQSVPGPGGVAI